MMLATIKSEVLILAIILFTLTLIFFSCSKEEKHSVQDELRITWFRTQVGVPIDTNNSETRVYYILKVSNARSYNVVMHLKSADKCQYLYNIIGYDTISLWDQRGNDSIIIPKQDTFCFEVKRTINQLHRPGLSFNESLIKELEMTNKSSILYLMKDSLSVCNHNSFFKCDIPKDSLYSFEIIYNYSTKNYQLYYPHISHF
jgi:hypothetical protein